MPFIELTGLNEVKEPEIAPEAEYALQITMAEGYVNDKGRDVIKVRIEFQDHPDYASFMHWVAVPNRALDIEAHPDGEEAGQSKYEMMMRGVKRFLELWSVSADNGFDPADLQGATCIAKVGQEVSDEGITNQRLYVPKMQS